MVVEQLNIFMEKNEFQLLPCTILRNNPKGVRDLNLRAKTYKSLGGTSLVVQWLRMCLPMQGTQVRALVQEDPTCHGATEPVCHNY